MRFLGHVMMEGQLESVVMEGLIEGRRPRGRPREKYMDGIKRVVGRGLTSARLLQMTANREDWRSMVAHVLEDMVLW